MRNSCTHVLLLISIVLLGGIAAIQANPTIATHFCVSWSVCLSVVCHIRAPCSACLKRSSDAIWQVLCVGSSCH